MVLDVYPWCLREAKSSKALPCSRSILYIFVYFYQHNTYGGLGAWAWKPGVPNLYRGRDGGRGDGEIKICINWLGTPSDYVQLWGP